MSALSLSEKSCNESKKNKNKVEYRDPFLRVDSKNTFTRFKNVSTVVIIIILNLYICVSATTPSKFCSRYQRGGDAVYYYFFVLKNICKTLSFQNAHGRNVSIFHCYSFPRRSSYRPQFIIYIYYYFFDLDSYLTIDFQKKRIP